MSKKRRQQPFNPFICEDCSTEKGKHLECKGCYKNEGTMSNIESCFCC